MILVFGATGRVGRELVAQLVAEGHPVRAFVRDPTRARLGAGVELVRGALEEPETLPAALAGVDRVFLLTTGPNALELDRNVADAVLRGGGAHVVKLSSVAAQPPIDNSYAAAHAAGERAIRQASPSCTIIRPAAFMSNVEYWRQSIETEGTVYASFGDIPRAVVDPRDVAAVAARTLVEDGHAGKCYLVTGPEALTVPEQVERMASVLGKPLRYREVPDSAAREAMLNDGMDPELVKGLLASQGDPDPARGGVPVSTVEDLIGRAATAFQDWLTREFSPSSGV